MSIARDSLAYWFAQAGNFAFSFVTSVFVAVILGPENRGVLIAVLLANTLTVNLTNMGLQALSMYFVGKQRDRLSRFHTLIVMIVAAVALIDFALIAIGGDYVRRNVFDAVPWRYLGLALAALPFSLYYFAAQGVLTGLGRVRDLSRFLFFYSVATNAANLAVLGFLGANVAALLVVWMSSQLIGSVVLFFMVRRSGCRWVRFSPGEAIQGAGELLSYGGRAFIGNAASVLVNRMDQIFILGGVGRMGIGIYSLSARLAELIFQPSAALENAGFARVAAAERNEAAHLVRDLFRTNFILNATAVAIMLLLAGPFVSFFYGEPYADAVRPLRILLPGTLFLSCSRMMALYFSAQLGKPQIPSAIAWITLAVNAPLMGWVVIKLQSGLVGAAWVTTGSYGVMLACYLVFFSMRTRLFNPLLLFIPQRRDFERARKLVRDVLSRGSV